LPYKGHSRSAFRNFLSFIFSHDEILQLL
jgi:hypothetical protein